MKPHIDPRLGIDFGTSHTVAAVGGVGRPAQPVLFDASPLLLSGVYAEADGRLLTGRDAERAAGRDPARYEPNPKRRIDDGSVLLGSDAYRVVDVIAAVLTRVAGDAVRVLGEPPVATVLTYPATWGRQRRAVLTGAADRAGLAGPVLVPEPVAAAAYFTTVLGHRVPSGEAVAVYDLGAGTFDTSVLRRTAEDGWELVRSRGLAEIGGLDLDSAIVDWIGATVGVRDRQMWRRLLGSDGDADRRARRALWTDVRAAKEQLSRTSSVVVQVPLLDVEVLLTRTEFEQLARPYLARTVELTASTITEAGARGQRPARVFLVGGGSRIPLVGTLLHQRLGVAPTLIEEPELVVAQGSVLALAGTLGAAGAGAAMSGLSRPAPPPADEGWSAGPAPSGLPGRPSGVPADVSPASAATYGAPPRMSPAGRVRPGRAATRRPGSAIGRHPTAAVIAAAVLVAMAGAGLWVAGKLPGARPNSNAPGSLAVNRTVWYAGLELTFGTASHRADRRVSVTLKVDNPAPTSAEVDMPILLGYRGKTIRGEIDAATGVAGKTSTFGTVEFAPDFDVADLREVVLTIGRGDERRPVLPFGAAAGLIDLKPRSVTLTGTRAVGFLKYTAHSCEVRGDIANTHRQARDTEMIITCSVDVQVLPGTLSYNIADEAFRLVFPDGTVVAPVDAPNELTGTEEIRRGLTASFAVPDPVRGTYQLKLRDPGRIGNNAVTPDKEWTIPIPVS